MASARAVDLPALLLAYVVPKAWDWALFGVLAMFLQTLAPNKLAGWGLLVLYLIAGLALDQLGYRDPLYRFGGYPGSPLPPALSGVRGAVPYVLLWSGVAALMLGVALWRSGRRRRS